MPAVLLLIPRNIISYMTPPPSYPGATSRKNPSLHSISYVQSLSEYAVQHMLRLTRSFFMSSNQRIFRLASSLYFQASCKQLSRGKILWQKFTINSMLGLVSHVNIVPAYLWVDAQGKNLNGNIFN